MAFVLSDEEQMIESMVAEFARDQIGLETAHDADRHDRFPEEAVQAAAALGLMGMTVSEDQGGAGTTSTAYALAIERIARVCVNTAVALSVHNAGLRILAEAGHDAVQGAAAGGLLALLATEEAHGSDKHTLGTDAVPTDDGFRLSGMKVWAINAAAAKHFLVLARVRDAGPTWFLVPADAEGVALGQNEPLMGLRASGIRTVYLSGVKVPKEAQVGDAGAGADLLARAMPWLHVGVAAAAVGATRGGFEAAQDFAESRVQFGKPIGTYQAVSDTLTEVDVQCSAAHALTLQAAARLGQDDAAPFAARAKAFACEMAIPMTRSNIRIQGGTGFMREGGTERFARDVRALQFVGEPVHMQRDVLKRSLLDIEFEAAP